MRIAVGGLRRLGVLTLVGLVVALGAHPGAAEAHGPVAPAASSYFAKVLELPGGLDAKVVDGDVRMWLQVPPSETLVVLDYRGAPYLRFSRAGVDVNQNSSMYYLNQTPIAETPPSNLTAATPPSWHHVSGGHHYLWHDGRLHALATVALSPGVSFVGRWSVPVRIDGRLRAISGGLWHADAPSIVWFWPIVVLLACVLAAWRLRRPTLDSRIAGALAIVALIALTIGGWGRELDGRPTVSIWQLVQLVAILSFAGWMLWRVLSRRAGYFSYFLIAIAALWGGALTVTTLLYGFVLIAEPAFVARVVTVLCLGCGTGLLLLGFRLADYAEPDTIRDEPADAIGGEPGSITESLA